MVRIKGVRSFDDGFVVETKQEVIAFVGFEDYKEAQAAVDACLRSLDDIRCPHCGAEQEEAKG